MEMAQTSGIALLDITVEMVQYSGMVLLPLLLKGDYWRDGIEFRNSKVCSFSGKWHNIHST